MPQENADAIAALLADDSSWPASYRGKEFEIHSRPFQDTQDLFKSLERRIWVSSTRPAELPPDQCGAVPNQVATVYLIDYLEKFDCDKNQQPLVEAIKWANKIYAQIGKAGWGVFCEAWFSDEFLVSDKLFACAIECTDV